MTNTSKINVTKGDIMIALRILAITAAAIVLYFVWDTTATWFLLAAVGFSEIALSLRYLSIMVRECPPTYYITNVSGGGGVAGGGGRGGAGGTTGGGMGGGGYRV